MAKLVITTSSKSYASAQAAEEGLNRFDLEASHRKIYKKSERDFIHASTRAFVISAFEILALTADELITSKPSKWAVDKPEIGAIGESDRKSKLASEINAYRLLQAGWDGEEGKSPSSEAVEEALNFINLLPLDAPLPKTSVAGDGEVGFYWRSPKGFIDVSFYGDGNIYFYVRINDEGIDKDGAPTFTGLSIPKILDEAITKI